MNTYCGNINEQIPPFSARLSNVDGRYGLENLYCRWVIYNDNSSKFVLINNTFYINTDNMIFNIEINYLNGRVSYYKPENRNFALIAENAQYIFLHMLMDSPFEILPFSITFVEQEDLIQNFFGLGISIGTIIIITLFCVFLICSRILIRNRYRNNDRRIGGQNYISELELRTKNMEKLKILYETVLKPVEYDPGLNDFNCDCTICLEEFKKGTQVMIFTCKHLFHYKCAQNWFEKNLLNPKCPNCNLILIEENSEPAENLQNNFMVLNENRIGNENNVSNVVNYNNNNASNNNNNTQNVQINLQDQSVRIITRNQIVELQPNNIVHVHINRSMNNINVNNNLNTTDNIILNGRNHVSDINIDGGTRNNYFMREYDSNLNPINQGNIQEN